MITLDASVLVAHFGPQDAHHAAATRVLLDAAVADEALLLHSITLAEVLVGGTRIGRGPEMLADIQALGVEMARHDDGEPLRLAGLRATSGLKMPDCCVLDAALRHTTALAAFDHGLRTAARRLGIAVVP
ncbi:MAG: type II toxin-antitoxin system VapC family toxin [Acidimicrobiales bacterium]